MQPRRTERGHDSGDRSTSHPVKNEGEWMRRSSWITSEIGDCATCGKHFESHTNGRAMGARHAKKYGHIVHIDSVRCTEYDGTKDDQ